MFVKLFLQHSSSEKVALELTHNKKYKFYDPYNSISYKTIEQLENELAIIFIHHINSNKKIFLININGIIN